MMIVKETKDQQMTNLTNVSIVVKLCVGSARFMGWTDNRRMVHKRVTDSPKNTSQILN